MSEKDGFTVGQVSELAGVTVRTLHHYDDVGLLRPSGRTDSGYRLYDEADLERLSQILVYRELGFSLEDIAEILADDSDPTLHLVRQHALIEGRIVRLQQVLSAIEKQMEAGKMGIGLTPEERFEVWGGFDPDEYSTEVEQRWGDTDAFKESQKRAARYGKNEWLAIKVEGADISERLVAAMEAGTPANAPEVMGIVEEHRLHISKWFYECSHSMHRGLGEMYVSDPRFKETYDKIAEGLATYLRDAIRANAKRHHPPA
jgi:MerR family transcriptional regulator, thiopeptide resistance regulator